MLHIRLVLALLVSVAISAYAATTPQAAVSFNDLAEKGSLAQSQLRECRSNALNTPTGQKLVAAKIVAFQNDPDRMRVLSNTSKLSKQQKQILVDFLVMNHQCQEGFLATFGSNSLSEIESRYFSINDFIYVDMINGKITISEGNRRLIEARENKKRDSDAELDRLYGRAIAAIEKSRQQRDADGQVLIQMLGTTRTRLDATSSPIDQTNCIQNGYSVNCSTYRY